MSRYYVPVVLVLHSDGERTADADAIRALDTMATHAGIEGYILPDGLKVSPASAAWHDLEQVVRNGRIEEVTP